ncbi:MAG TPA: hypothetical protein VK005_01855 [Acholeplasma sp.]|jgi:predicted RNase H-like nuclease (RuvC/YqgF family)|nr:hypothetical protein [Acholeplasma sp.]
MNLSPTNQWLFDLLIGAFFVSLIIAVIPIVLTICLYCYRRYQKWHNKEAKELEKIIVKNNEEIKSSNETINTLKPLENELKLHVENLKLELAALKKEKSDLTGEVITEETSDVDMKKLTHKELLTIAKDRKLKGYSRKSKEELLKMLNPAG